MLRPRPQFDNESVPAGSRAPVRTTRWRVSPSRNRANFLVRLRRHRAMTHGLACKACGGRAHSLANRARPLRRETPWRRPKPRASGALRPPVARRQGLKARPDRKRERERGPSFAEGGARTSERALAPRARKRARNCRRSLRSGSCRRAVGARATLEQRSCGAPATLDGCTRGPGERARRDTMARNTRRWQRGLRTALHRGACMSTRIGAETEREDSLQAPTRR